MSGFGEDHVRAAVPDGYWDHVSGSYDRQLWLERAPVRTALTLLALRPEDRLLDVATGTGGVLRQLATSSGKPHDAVGVDASAAMLAQVPPLPDGWSVTVARAQALPFAAGEFSAVSCCYLLHMVADADRPAILAELRRVLTPGGRIAVVTPAVPDRGLARPMARALNHLAVRHPRRCGGLRALDPRPGLQRAGFELVESRWSTRGYISICVLARRPAHDPV